MPTTDPRVDRYISQAPAFAQPILSHVRRIVHSACPKVEETMKWGFPHFLHQGILCNMAAFKQHCSVGFWKHALLFPEERAPAGGLTEPGGNGMGQFGRVTAVSDLPTATELAELVRRAAALNEAGVKRPVREVPKAKPKVQVPRDLAAALKGNAQARTTFAGFSYTHKKEYVEWLTEAKTEATRQKRLATALEWLTEGKSRHWKYQRC